jgi:hypothetical protein
MSDSHHSPIALEDDASRGMPPAGQVAVDADLVIVNLAELGASDAARSSWCWADCAVCGPLTMTSA